MNMLMNPGKTILSSAILKLVDKDWLDFAIGHVNPLFSVDRIKARVVGFHQETTDTMSVELEPNSNWTGFVPGQFVPVHVNIKGVLHERCYSLTGEPGASTVRITVKRQPNGLVSNWIQNHLVIGDVIELGKPAG